MYIMINDIKGEKMIDLSYPIHSNPGQGKEIAVVSVHISKFSDFVTQIYRSVVHHEKENFVE